MTDLRKLERFGLPPEAEAAQCQETMSSLASVETSFWC